MINKFCIQDCVKSVHIRSFSGPYFQAFGLRIFPNSVRMWENTDQKKSEYGQFSCSARFAVNEELDGDKFLLEIVNWQECLETFSIKT